MRREGSEGVGGEVQGKEKETREDRCGVDGIEGKGRGGKESREREEASREVEE